MFVKIDKWYFEKVWKDPFISQTPNHTKFLNRPQRSASGLLPWCLSLPWPDLSVYTSALFHCELLTIIWHLHTFSCVCMNNCIVLKKTQLITMNDSLLISKTKWELYGTKIWSRFMPDSTQHNIKIMKWTFIRVSHWSFQ